MKSKVINIALVDNWQTGYKWFSSWAFVVIVFLATTPLPPEITDLLPPIIQDRLTTIVAMCGLILRFVKQSKGNTGGNDGYD